MIEPRKYWYGVGCKKPDLPEGWAWAEAKDAFLVAISRNGSEWFFDGNTFYLKEDDSMRLTVEDMKKIR